MRLGCIDDMGQYCSEIDPFPAKTLKTRGTKECRIVVQSVREFVFDTLPASHTCMHFSLPAENPKHFRWFRSRQEQEVRGVFHLEDTKLLTFAMHTPQSLYIPYCKNCMHAVIRVLIVAPKPVIINYLYLGRIIFACCFLRCKYDG